MDPENLINNRILSIIDDFFNTVNVRDPVMPSYYIVQNIATEYLILNPNISNPDSSFVKSLNEYNGLMVPPKVKVEECDKLSEKDKYTYVYIYYNLVLENSQEYPCVGTYMVEKNGSKYYVMPPSEITDELRTQAATDYAKFMTTDTYKNYTKAYNVFVKKNPGYEEKIANKLNAE